MTYLKIGTGNENMFSGHSMYRRNQWCILGTSPAPGCIQDITERYY